MDACHSQENRFMEVLRPQNRALIPKLSPEERFSFNENVNEDNIREIESWMGNYEEVERVLFWDKGGKYDDPVWKRNAIRSAENTGISSFCGTIISVTFSRQPRRKTRGWCCLQPPLVAEDAVGRLRPSKTTQGSILRSPLPL